MKTIQNLKGKHFGDYFVLEFVERKNGKTYWLCRKGRKKKILTAGYLKFIDKYKLKPVYDAMKQRCYNVNNKNYHNYGFRGITVCQEWLESYQNFENWAMKNGYKKGLSIDRIDVNGNYEPSDCRWVTLQAQQKNRRDNIFYKFRDKMYTEIDWKKILRVSKTSLTKMVEIGMLEKLI